MVPTTSIVATLAGANVCALERRLVQGVGATENSFEVHDDHNLFDLENKSAAECLYSKNNDRDDVEQDAKHMQCTLLRSASQCIHFVLLVFGSVNNKRAC